MAPPPVDPQKLAEERLDIELREVLGTKAGRSVLRRIIYVNAGILKPDPVTGLERQAGRRDVGLALLAELLRVAPERYLELEQERLGVEAQESAAGS